MQRGLSAIAELLVTVLLTSQHARQPLFLAKSMRGSVQVKLEKFTQTFDLPDLSPIFTKGKSPNFDPVAIRAAVVSNGSKCNSSESEIQNKLDHWPIYSVSQKKVAPLKLFAIFLLAVNLCN